MKTKRFMGSYVPLTIVAAFAPTVYYPAAQRHTNGGHSSCDLSEALQIDP
jgi:hypothetical protein